MLHFSPWPTIVKQARGGGVHFTSKTETTLARRGGDYHEGRPESCLEML